ncbi:MAG: recombination protein RecR [Deltaproteobacteria bacterium]|nr:recombination protein RecR [Deltaproteobacteria bacterium]
MSIYPPPLEELISQLSRLPGIGRKSATRVALFILRQDEGLARDLARSILHVKESIRLCSVCFNLTDSDPCRICRDESRDAEVLCVVEGPDDQMAIEESGAFRGRYHVLHGTLSPLDGIGPEDLKIGELLKRLDREEVKEVILATNPTTEGEATSSYLAGLLVSRNVKVTRIALGIPMGGNLRFMDSLTLQHSLKSRSPVRP